MTTKATPTQTPERGANGHDTTPEVEPKPAAEESPPAAESSADSRLAETEDRLLRALAEQENIRRIAAREREEAIRYAASSLAADLLDTVDNLERAISSGESGTAPLERMIEGLNATQKGLLGALARHGISRVEPLGEPFDPNRDHAVYERAEADVEPGTVIEVLQPGYIINGRLLRPAMVGVAT